MDEHRLLPLIDTLYDAISNPALWATFLREAASYMDGSSAWLSHIDLQERTGSGLVFGIDPAMQEQYFAYYNLFDPFTGYIGDVRDAFYDQIITDEHLVDRSTLLRSTFYAEFMRKIDVHSISFVRLGRRGSRVRTLNINRSRNRRPFGAADLQHLRHIQGHVRRAVSLSERLAEMQIRGQQGDPPGSIMFLVDPDMRIHHESDAVESWGRQHDEVWSARGRLTVKDPEAHQRLAQLVRSTVDRKFLGPRGGSIIYKPRSETGAVEITVMPVKAEAIGPFPNKATTLVTLKPVESHNRNLSARYGLTPAETAVALLLVAGLSSREIAHQRGVSLVTVRTQVSQIMAKTGTHRQAETIRALKQ